MKRHNSTIQESAWTISNILAGNHTQIQIVIDAGCLQPLIDILVKGDFNAQKEAAWAVLNLTTALCKRDVGAGGQNFKKAIFHTFFFIEYDKK